ncbi:MAG: Carbon-nitrogen hydrolase [Chrysothrix sp. TS-e1954]|nr:MAG: Carbon-nitrogen hydrolase [Chrysothrix sp. TS-e1954]
MKLPLNYSNKQMADPQQAIELTCVYCERTRSLEYFSKAQRKTPDIAKCLECMQKQLAQVDPYDDALGKEYYETDSDSEDETGTVGGVTLGDTDTERGSMSYEEGQLVEQPRFYGGSTSTSQSATRNGSSITSSNARGAKKWAKPPDYPSLGKMKIACLQFDSQIGYVEDNVRKAERLLNATKPGDLDLLVLPELAFTGYNFLTLDAITPYLEPTAAGLSTTWARNTAIRLDCIVIVGYPEVETSARPTEQSTTGEPAVYDVASKLGERRYNSNVTVSRTGEVIGHYRKSHLYFADVPWASQGHGFHAGTLPLPSQTADGETKTTRMALGVCMDINPYAFEAPFTDYEFANHALRSSASLVILSMAWSSSLLIPGDMQGAKGKEIDLSTVGYWIERFKPLIDKQGDDVIIVMANRCGTEKDREDGRGTVFYTGSSTVMKVGQGKVESWGFAGKSKEGLLVVDTDADPNLSVVLGGPTPNAEMFDARIIHKTR